MAGAGAGTGGPQISPELLARARSESNKASDE
jgi:hypothetical protein